MTLADFALTKITDDYLKNISASHLARINEMQSNLQRLERKMDEKDDLFNERLLGLELNYSSLLARVDFLECNRSAHKESEPKDDIYEYYRPSASSEIVATCAGRLIWRISSMSPIYARTVVGEIEMKPGERYPLVTQGAGRLHIYVSAGTHVTPGRVLAQLVDH